MQLYATAIHVVLLGIISVISLAALIGLNIPWRWKMRRFPGPTPTILLGNLADYVKLLPTRAHATWFERYGSVYVMYMGSLPYVVVRDADMVHEIMVKQFKHFPGRATVFAPLDRIPRRVFFNNIFASKGSMWSTVRSIVQPLFHSTSLRKFAPFMREAVDRTVAMLSRHVIDDVSTNVCVDAVTTRDVVTQDNKAAASMVRIACDSTARGKQRLHAAVSQAAKMMLNTPIPSIFTAATLVLPPAAVPLLAWLSKRFGTAASKHVEAGRIKLAGVAYGLMNAARQRHNLPAYTPHPDFIPSSAVIESGMVPKEGTLLDLLVQAQHKDSKQPLSDIQIVPQVNAFLIAGHETTAGVLSLAVYLIAQHPAVEQRLRQELQQHAGLQLDSPEACEKLAYTQACIKETMRVMPVAPMTHRFAACDTTVGGWQFPRGVNVTIDIWGLHHDARYWSNPEQFIPERFLSNAEPKHPMAYIPFGAGPRICVGLRFAMQEATIALAQLYQQFTFKLSRRYEHEELEMRFSLTCVPRNGVWVSVHPAATFV